ncbi:MAG: hypothetical protein GY940_27690 [bacterium]|nr:hypothetical protein [bacterium]
MIIKIVCKFPAGDLRFATQNIRDGSGNWQNKIINISSLSRNIGEDKSYEVSGISIEFNDTDRYFREMMSGTQRFIAGKKVELYREDDQLIYTGAVEKWVFKEDAFELHINDRLSGLETIVPGTITTDDYPNMAEKADGESVPIIYGTLDTTGGAVKCWKVDTGKFLLAGHHCKELIDSAAYEEDGLPVTGGVSLDPNADGRAYVLCGSTKDFIYVNVKGKMDAGSNLIEDPIDALKDIIDTYTAMTYDGPAMDEAQAIAGARGYKIAGVIDNQKNLQDVLVEFCFSFDCDFYIGKGSEIMISLLDWSTLTPTRSYTEARIVDFQIEELPDDIRNKVKYMYRYNFATGEFQRTPVFSKESSITDWGEFYNKNEALDLRYVWDNDSAFDVVQRYVIQRKNPTRKAMVSIPLAEFIGVDISDIIEIQHPGAIDTNKRKYQVRRIDIDFISDIVQVEALDITTLTGGIFVLGSRDDTNLKAKWDDNDDYSRGYGYLADRDDWYFSNDTDYGKVLY